MSLKKRKRALCRLITGEVILATAEETVALADLGELVECRCAGHGGNGVECGALLTPVRTYRRGSGTIVAAYFTIRRHHSHVEGCEFDTTRVPGTGNSSYLAAMRRAVFSLSRFYERIINPQGRKRTGSTKPRHTGGLGIPRTIHTAFARHLDGSFGREDEYFELFEDGANTFESFLSVKTIPFYLKNPEKLGGRPMIVTLRLCRRPEILKAVLSEVPDGWLMESSAVDPKNNLQFLFLLRIEQKERCSVIHKIMESKDKEILCLADWSKCRQYSNNYYIVEGHIISDKQLEKL